MVDSKQPIDERWKRPVARVRVRIIFGWFWSSLILWVMVAASVGSFLSWTLRGFEQSETPGWLTGLGLIAAGSLHAWSRLSSKHLRIMDAVARLDEGWGMNQSLIRAYSQQNEWPDLPVNSRVVPLRIRWQAWAPPVCLSLLFVALAQWIPVVTSAPAASTLRRAPAEWQELESFLETLQEEDIVEPDALSGLNDQLDRLQALPEEDWYGPAGLEATDRLREQVKTQANRLTQGMQQTAQLLQLAEENQTSLSLSQQAALQQSLQRMLQEMEESGLPLSQQHMNRLRQVDLSQLPEISKEQLQQLQEQMNSQSQATEEALLAAGLLAEGGGMGPPGTEGGGPVDLGIGKDASVGTPMTEVLLDMKQSESLQVGDLLETREIEHSESRTRIIPSAGAVSSPGGSGSATWQRDLSPSEQRVLQQFFKSNSSP